MTTANDTQARVIRNAALLLGRQLVVTALGLVAAALIARHLGPRGLGRFEYTFALVGVFATIATFGLRGVTIRSVAHGDRPLGSYLSLMCSLRLLLSLAVWPVLMVVVYLNDDREALFALVAIASVTLPVNALGMTLRDAFQGQERFDVEAAASIAARLATFAGVVVVVRQGGSATAMVAVYAAGSGVALLVPLVATWRARGPVGLRWSTPEAVRELRYALPFGANAAIGLLMWEVNPILIEGLSGLAMVGVFAVGGRLLVPLAMIPDAVSDALTPAVTRLWAGSDGAQQCGALVSRSLFGLLALGLPMAAGAALCADELIALVFGDQFGEAGTVLRVMAFVLPLEFVAVAMADALAAIYQQNGRLWISCAGAAINVGLTVVLVPYYGAAGCAWAVAATTTFCSVAYTALFSRHCRLSFDLVAYLKLAVTVAAMIALMSWTLRFGVLISLAAGAAVYAASALCGVIAVKPLLRALRPTATAAGGSSS